MLQLNNKLNNKRPKKCSTTFRGTRQSARPLAGRYIHRKMSFRIILLLLVFAATSHATIIREQVPLKRQSITYEMAGPSPIDSIKVVFHLNFLGISALDIVVNGTPYTLDSDELDINYHPQIDNLYFFYSRTDKNEGTLTSAKLKIPYDRKAYVDCGEEGRKGYFKEKIIIINAYSRPEVVDGQTVEKECLKKDSEMYPLEPIYGEKI